MPARMTIMVGCQGSGKSTWAKENRISCAIAPVEYCSADDYFMVSNRYQFDVTKLGKAHGACFKKAVFAVVQGKSVVVDNTNGSVSEIAPYYALGQAFGMEVEVIRMVCDPEVAAARNLHGVSEAGVKATARKIANLKLPPYWTVTEKTIWTTT